jgi:hypothetical protein
MSTPKIVTAHIPGVCGACGPRLRCKTCGNNACNGGYGEVDGKKCPDCPDCYDVQAVWWENADAVEFDPPLTAEQNEAFSKARDDQNRRYAEPSGDEGTG